VSKKKQSLELTVIEQEPRVDSRLMAERLGIQHKSFLETIRKHENKISDFGLLPFETEKVSLGRPEVFTLLNEDQSIFVLTLSRNTDQVVLLKQDLTKQFSRYRSMVMKHARAMLRQANIEAQQARLEGKTERREVTDAIKRLVELADSQDPENNARKYYITFTNMVTKLLFNIKTHIKNVRDEIPTSALRKLQAVEGIVASWINQEVDRGGDYHEAYPAVKERTKALVNLIGTYDLSLPTIATPSGHVAARFRLGLR